MFSTANAELIASRQETNQDAFSRQEGSVNYLVKQEVVQNTTDDNLAISRRIDNMLVEKQSSSWSYQSPGTAYTRRH